MSTVTKPAAYYNTIYLHLQTTNGQSGQEIMDTWSLLQLPFAVNAMLKEKRDHVTGIFLLFGQNRAEITTQ